MQSEVTHCSLVLTILMIVIVVIISAGVCNVCQRIQVDIDLGHPETMLSDYGDKFLIFDTNGSDMSFKEFLIQFNLLCTIALNVKGVSSSVTAWTLKTGDDSHTARTDFTHNVWKNHCIVRAVSENNKADVISTNILDKTVKFIIQPIS